MPCVSVYPPIAVFVLSFISIDAYFHDETLKFSSEAIFSPFTVAVVAVCTNWTTCNIYLFIPLSCLLPFMVKHTFASKMKSSQERASTLSIEYIFYVSIFAYFARSANSFASLSLSLALFPSLSYAVQTHTDRTQAASLCRSQLLYTILLRFF